MTLDINEAKNILKENMDELVKNPLVTIDERLVKANNMAIKSLEAWEKIKKEIKQIRIHCGYLDVQGVTIIEVLEIIDKHLSEVSE